MSKTDDLLKRAEEPPPLPQAWVGMYQGRKRDAMYYEKCLKDLRISIPNIDCYGDPFELIDRWISLILAHEYNADGVDLDKPNYGMFE